MNDEKKIDICRFMCDYNLSLGKVCKEFDISKTTLYYFIRYELKYLHRGLYDALMHQMENRKKGE